MDGSTLPPLVQGAECHFYLAEIVYFLNCADTGVMITSSNLASLGASTKLFGVNDPCAVYRLP